TVDQLETAHFDETLQVNLRAPALLAARAGTAMAQDGGGVIVTIASAAALRPLAEHHAYSVAHAGLVMATRTLALELRAPSARVAQPHAGSAVAVRLASDAASMANGAEIPVDGGYLVS